MVETSNRPRQFQFNRETGVLNAKRGDMDITIAPDPHHKDRGTFKALHSLNRRELPQNQELSNMILRSKQALESNKTIVDEHGKLLIDDMNNVLDSVNRLLRSKNADGKLQRLTQTSGLEAKRAGKKSVEQLQEHKEEGRAARGEAVSALMGGKDVAVLLVRSPRFRSLLTELIALMPKFAGRVTEKHGSELAEGVKRDADQLRGVESTQKATEGSRTADVIRTLRDEVRSGEVITEQEKTNIQIKFTDILKEISANERYKSTVQTVFRMAERYRPARERIGSEVRNSTSSETDQMKKDTRNLISEFAGYEAVNRFYASLDDFVELTRHDEESMSFWRELRRFVSDSFSNPSMLDSESEKTRMKNLFDRGRRVFVDNDELYDSLGRLRDSTTEMLGNVKEDADLNLVKDRIAKLMNDATMGSDGKPNIDTILSSSRDIRRIVVPTLKQQLHNVPLPKIVGRSSRYEFELENMVIDGRELLPDTFFVDTRTKFWVSTSKLSTNNAVYKFKFFVEDIRPRMHNFLYRVRTLKFPRIHDNGRASIDFEGRGISFLVKYELHYEQNRAPYIKVKRINTNIDKMNIKIHDAKHKMIDRALLLLFGGLIKRQIAKTAQARVYEQLKKLDNKVNSSIYQAYSSDQKNLINRGKTATNEAMGMAYEGSKKVRSRARDYTEKLKRGGSRVKGMLREERQKPKIASTSSSVPQESSSTFGRGTQTGTQQTLPTVTQPSPLGSKQTEISSITQEPTLQGSVS